MAMAKIKYFVVWLLRVFLPVLMAGGLFVTAVLAVVMGAVDTFRPVTVTTQLIGAFLLIFGLLAASGLAALIRLLDVVLPWPPWAWATELRPWADRHRWTILAAEVGATTGVYISLTVVLYSYRYRPAETAVFGILALLSVGLAAFLAPAVRLVWSTVGATVKSLSAVGGALALLVQFWYQQGYLPENTQVGIHYTVDVGAVTPDGSYSLVPITLTMENVSSVTALTLQSMVEVRAVAFTAAGGSADVSPTILQQRLIDAAEHGQEPAYDIGFNGQENPTTVAVLRPIDNASYLWPNAPYTKEFVVAAPKQDQALQIYVQVDYARAPRLVLGSGFRATSHPEGCPRADVITDAWRIKESALRAFTTGDLALYSYWCASSAHPLIGQIISAPGTVESPGNEAALQAHFGTSHSTRDEWVLIPPGHG
jgi:hypothetical protein